MIKSTLRLYNPFSSEEGGAALEYISVSGFGLVLSIAAISFISESIDQKFINLQESTGVEFSASNLNPFK